MTDLCDTVFADIEMWASFRAFENYVCNLTSQKSDRFETKISKTLNSSFSIRMGFKKTYPDTRHFFQEIPERT